MKLCYFLAIENYSQLLDCCYEHGQGWTASIELEIIRLGAFLGHDQIVAFFLESDEEKYLASCSELQNAAILGAAEAGREADWRRLIESYGLPSDPASIEEDTSKIEDFQKRRDMRFDMLVSSHAAVIVYGYLYTATMRPRTHYEVTIKLLLKDQT